MGKRISEMTPAAQLNGNDIVPIVDTGGNNRTVTGNQIKSFATNGMFVFSTRQNLQQPPGVSYWTFTNIPLKTGYSRMVIAANPSIANVVYTRFTVDGNNMRIYMNNQSDVTVTYDLSIAVVYISN